MIFAFAVYVIVSRTSGPGCIWEFIADSKSYSKPGIMPEKNLCGPGHLRAGTIRHFDVVPDLSDAGTSQHFNAVPDLSKAGTT